MPEKTPNQMIPGKGGFIEELGLRARLIIRLMADSRVSFWLKLIPVGSIIYLFNPIDVPGPLDDAAIFGLGIYLFLELCPQEIVEEHMQSLRKTVSDGTRPKTQTSDVVDAEFREIPPDQPKSET